MKLKDDEKPLFGIVADHEVLKILKFEGRNIYFKWIENKKPDNPI
jgi:hypothetical protein